MKLKEFYYDLPPELISQEPMKERDMSRLMVLDRGDGSISEGFFRDITGYINEGDCIVLNDTRVIPARLYGKRRTGGKVEVFVLNPGADRLKALIRPSKRIKFEEEIELESGHVVTVLEETDPGRFVKFNAPLAEVMKNGHMPLPPYISRDDRPRDRFDYQTVYARTDGATASPTAGLHFTEELLEALKKKGVQIAFVTLHTSYGTFAPVRAENIEDHIMHSEYYVMDETTADIVNRTKASGKRIISVGTTSTRVLESSAAGDGRVAPGEGHTDIFIYPGYHHKIVDGLITNFHLPESTLLMLVSAFADRELILKAYHEAIQRKFRFFSYGDAMLIV